MAMYATKQPGDTGVMPPKPGREPIATEDITDDTPYAELKKEQLIALCDDRDIMSKKGTPVGRFQKKAYYIERLITADKLKDS